MKLNLASGAHPLDGFVNLDKITGWAFEDGLPYPDASVEAITESHGLMYVSLTNWPVVFSEFARVLAPGGVIRITEDATDDRRSSRYGGFHGAVTRTSRSLVRMHLEAAGLEVFDVKQDESHFKDMSLVQRWHGAEPKVFHIEGVKS